MIKGLPSSKNLILTASSLFLTLLFVEIGFRVWGQVNHFDYRLYLKEFTRSDRLPREIFLKDPTFGIRLKPGAKGLAVTSDFSVEYRINSNGLRDEEIPYSKGDSRRILAMGDSFTFGEGIPYGKRFTEVPEKERSGIEIVNMGIPGYGLDRILMLLKTEGAKYQPDIVLLFINYVDTVRQYYSSQSEFSHKETLYLQATDPIFQSNDKIARYSALWAYIRFQFLRWNLRDRLEQDDKKKWGKSKNLPEEDDVLVSKDPIKQRTLLLLNEFTALSKKHGFWLIVVNIDPRPALDYLKQDMPLGTTYLDLSKKLIMRSRKDPLRFKYDRHFNESTHGWIGMELTRFFEKSFIGKNN